MKTLTAIVILFTVIPSFAATHDCIDDSQPSHEKKWVQLYGKSPENVQIAAALREDGVHVSIANTSRMANKILLTGRQWRLASAPIVLRHGSYCLQASPAYQEEGSPVAIVSREFLQTDFDIEGTVDYPQEKDFMNGSGTFDPESYIFISPLSVYAGANETLRFSRTGENPRTGINSRSDGTLVTCHTAAYQFSPTENPFNCNLDVTDRTFDVRLVMSPQTTMRPEWTVTCQGQNYITDPVSGAAVLDKPRSINVTGEFLRRN